MSIISDFTDFTDFTCFIYPQNNSKNTTNKNRRASKLMIREAKQKALLHSAILSLLRYWSRLFISSSNSNVSWQEPVQSGPKYHSSCCGDDPGEDSIPRLSCTTAMHDSSASTSQTHDAVGDLWSQPRTERREEGQLDLHFYFPFHGRDKCY